MAIWSVSCVAPSHASVPAMSIPQRKVLVEELSPHATAEPELALGLRLFWAIILAMTLVIVIPITLGWSLRPAPDPGAEVVIRPAILADRVASPKEITPQDLPKAQAPPLQLLQYGRGHVAPKEN
jgi:hypothetical protein